MIAIIAMGTTEPYEKTEQKKNEPNFSAINEALGNNLYEFEYTDIERYSEACFEFSDFLDTDILMCKFTKEDCERIENELQDITFRLDNLKRFIIESDKSED